MLNLNEITADWELWSSLPSECWIEGKEHISKLLTWLPALVEELREARTTIECLRQSLAVEIQLVEEALAEIERLRALVPTADLLHRLSDQAEACAARLNDQPGVFRSIREIAIRGRNLAWRIEKATETALTPEAASRIWDRMQQLEAEATDDDQSQ